MPIGSTNVYNPGDLILSTVSGSGTSFIETKIASATSSLILFNSSGTLTSASLNSTTVGTASYVSGSTSIITSITASNISASGKIQANQITASSILANNGPLMVTGSNAYIQMFPVGGFSLPTNLTASYIYTSGSTNDMYFTQYNGPYTNTTRLRWLESNLYTGILHGGVLTSTPGSTTFTVTEGEGLIVSLNAFTASSPYPTVKLISWATSTQPITYSGSAKITYVGINDIGGIVQQTNAWGSTDINQWDNQIELGVVLHLSGSVSSGVFNSQQISYGIPQQTDDFFRAFGPLKISGHTLQASGSSPTLSIKKTGGSAYREGANYVSNPNHPSTVVENDVNTSKIYRYYLSGSTPIIDTGINNAGYTTIDNNYYVDTTTGQLATVGNSNWSIQRVFWIPNSPTNAFIVYYGNATYSTLLNAVNAKDSEPFTESPNTSLNAIFVGYIIIEGGIGKDLLNPIECTIIQGGLFRNVGGIGSSGTAPVSTTLAGLSDVALSGLAAGDLLVYGGGQWNNNKTLDGNYTITGSLTVTSTITGNLTGTSSWASNARTASYVVNSISSSYVSGSTSIITNITASNISASGAIIASSFTGSFSGSIGNAVNATSASYALTSSYISPSGNAFVQGGNSFGTTALLGTNDAQPLALETNGTTRMSINSNGNVAINTSTSPSVRLSISDTHQGSLGSSSLFITTVQNQNQGLATSANDSGINNLYFVNNFTSSAGIQNQAIFNQLYINGSGSFSGSYRASRNAINISNTASLDSGGNITNTYLTNQISPNIPTFSIPNWIAGTQTYVDLVTGNTTGSITNLYHHQITSPFNVGAGGITVTNSYGVYIGKQKTTNVVTNGWGIYQVDTGDLNIFAGKTRIGSTTVPVNTLDVTGNISASAYTGSSAIITNITASNISASGTSSFGYVGIGTTAPADKLSVISGSTRIASTALAGALYFGSDASNIYLQRDNNYDLSLVQNGDSNSALYLASAGNVYVNIDSNNNDTDKAFIVQNNALKAGTELFRVSETGNVGIGTTIPAAKLHVYNGLSHFEATSNGNAAIVAGLYALQIGPLHDRDSTAGRYYGGIAFNHLLNFGGATTYNGAPQAWIGTRLQDTTGSERDYLVFATKPGTGVSGTGNDIPIERMCIDRDGNVGIGTTIPVAKLQVAGNISGSSFTSSISNAVGFLGTSSFATNATSASFASNTISSSYSLTSSFATTAQTANALNVDNSYTIAGLTNNGTLSQQGTLSMGSGYQLLLTTGTAPIPSLSFVGDTNTGIYSPSADIIGFSISGSEQVRIDSSGNLGIGTSSPLAKLDVRNQAMIGDASIGGVAYQTLSIGGHTRIHDTYRLQFGSANGGFASIGITGATTGTLTFTTWDGSAFVERLRIVNTNGNVGIGVTNPLGRLHITGSVTNGESLVYLSKGSGSISQNYINAVDQSGNLNYRVQSDINGHLAEVLYQTGTSYVSFNTFWSSWINNNNYTQGGLGIGTTSQTHGYGVTIARPATSGSLYVSGSSVFTGSVNVSNNITCLSLTETSTEAVKYNILPLSSQLDNVLKLKPVSFNYKTNDKHSIGLIAEEVAKIYPEFTSDTNDSISYGKITSVLIQSIKELKTIIDNQQKQIEDLVNKLK